MAQGQQDLYDDTSQFNAVSFVVSQMIALVAGSTLVQVQACTTNDQADVIGTVDVLPLVNMLDGAGVASKHATIHKLTYCRVQGGADAVICDPRPGDIGVAVFASRDISAVKSSKAQANPGSFRQNSMSDGMYLFTAISAQKPKQWIRFLRDGDGNPIGIEMVDANGNSRVMNASGITDTDLNGNTVVMSSSGISVNGVLFDRSQHVTNPVEVTAQGGHTLTQHRHGGVQTGSGTTNTPTG